MRDAQESLVRLRRLSTLFQLGDISTSLPPPSSSWSSSSSSSIDRAKRNGHSNKNKTRKRKEKEEEEEEEEEEDRGAGQQDRDKMEDGGDDTKKRTFQQEVDNNEISFRAGGKDQVAWEESALWSALSTYPICVEMVRLVRIMKINILETSMNLTVLATSSIFSFFCERQQYQGIYEPDPEGAKIKKKIIKRRAVKKGKNQLSQHKKKARSSKTKKNMKHRR
eukprot:jgi/Bigna1/134503/aug1.25_g9211